MPCFQRGMVVSEGPGENRGDERGARERSVKELWKSDEGVGGEERRVQDMIARWGKG